MKLSIFKSDAFNNNILWFYNERTGNRVGYEYYNCKTPVLFYSRSYSNNTSELYGFEYIRSCKQYNI